MLEMREIPHEDMEELLDMMRERSRWLEETGRPMWNPDYLRREVFLEKYHNPRCFLAREGNENVGGFALTERADGFWENHHREGAVYLHKLVVAPRFSGRGYAVGIIGLLEELLRDEGRDILRIDYYGDRVNLKKLYGECGFVDRETLVMPDGTPICLAEKSIRP